jgi:hypothetical protein
LRFNGFRYCGGVWLGRGRSLLPPSRQRGPPTSAHRIAPSCGGSPKLGALTDTGGVVPLLVMVE